MTKLAGYELRFLVLLTLSFRGVGMAQTTYTITDLGTLGGSFCASGPINASGQVTGSCELAGDTTSHAFVISPPYTSMVDLGSFPGDFSDGTGINKSGQVTGTSFLVPGTNLPQHAFVISPPYSTMVDLGTLGGNVSGGSRINASGQVVGLSSTTATGGTHAFVSSPPYTSMIDLGTLGGPESYGYDINDSGQVTGSSLPSGGLPGHAFLISPPYASMMDLGTLGGSTSEGAAINNSGQIAGDSYLPGDTARHAILISPPYTSMIDLGSLGGTQGGALAIDTAGQVVGYSTTASNAVHAVLYTAANGLQDLNSLIPSGSGWTLRFATGINDVGQIAGSGINPNGAFRAFLLSPLNTPAGTNVVVQPKDTQTGRSPIALSFSTVTNGGFTGLTTSSSGPTPPAGFSLGSPSVYYSLSTTATYTGAITICINYAGISFPSGPQLFHFENNAWTNVTTSVNTTSQIVCGSATSLSPFALFVRPYTARIQPPINSDGSSVFAASRGVVPVKFTLAINGKSTCNLPLATIAVTRTAGGVAGPVDETVYNMPSDSGSNFRISSCQYVYNLNPKSLGPGTYRVDIRINNNTVGSGVFGLK